MTLVYFTCGDLLPVRTDLTPSDVMLKLGAALDAAPDVAYLELPHRGDTFFIRADLIAAVVTA